MPTTPDFYAVNHGSVITLTPQTKAARDWCREHIPDDALWWGGGVAIEPRYFPDIADGIDADGLTIN